MDEASSSTTKKHGQSRWTQSRATAKQIVSYLEVNVQDTLGFNLPSNIEGLSSSMVENTSQRFDQPGTSAGQYRNEPLSQRDNNMQIAEINEPHDESRENFDVANMEEVVAERFRRRRHNDDDTDDDDDDDDADAEQNEDSDTDTEENIENRRSKKPFLSSILEDLAIPVSTKNDVTAKDHLLVVVAASVKYHWTYEAMMSMLNWIGSTLQYNYLPKTKRSLWSALGRNDSVVKRHYYCQSCKDVIGEGAMVLRVCKCKKCGPNASRDNVAYFLEISLEAQIKELLKIPAIQESLSYRFLRRKIDPDGIEDIYDGEEYKKLTEPGEFLENRWNFSYTFNTDGAQVWESSNASAWPIFVQINELHPQARKKHILLAGVWVDTAHPIANSFMLPFVREAHKLYNEGITWKPDGHNDVVSKFLPVIFCADSQARWEFLRCSQFTAEFGCTFCYASGVPTPEVRNQRRYPAGPAADMRTDEEMRRHANAAFRTGERQFGVQGPSIISRLPGFNLATGVVVESMHNLHSGAIRQHTRLLLENSKEKYYIGSPIQKTLINERLLSIKLPSCVSRYPEIIDKHRQYKASQRRNLILYGLQCFEGILKPTYSKHLALLFEAAYILNKDSISSTDLIKAEECLAKYVELFQDIFGMAQMTYNIHLLTHLCQTVRKWGPLWAHSAFDFESMNRKIMQHITSPKDMPWQVYTRFLMHSFIQNVCYDPTVSEETRQFISKLLKTTTTIEYIYAPQNINHFKGLGKGLVREPLMSEYRLLERNGYHCSTFTVYSKARISGVEYRCEYVKPNTKFSNSLVFCDSIGFGRIFTIIDFVYRGAHVQGMFIRSLRHKSYAFGTTFISNVSDETPITVFIGVNEIRGPAFEVITTCGHRAIRLPNIWETD